MKKIIFVAFLLFSLSSLGQDMKSVYVNMPDSLSPLLTKVDREDFSDFLESNMRAQVKNKFDNTSEMKVLTSDYLFLQTTSSSTLQMKLLPVNETEKIVCLITTVNGPASDSSVFFYTTDWKELPRNTYLQLPEVDRFFLQNDTIDMEKQQLARQKADITLLKADLSATEPTITFTYTTPDYLNKESSEELKPFLKTSPIVYNWTNESYFN